MRNRPKQFKSDLSELRAKYAPTHKPVWVVLSHINWDSVADFAPMAYPTFDEWMSLDNPYWTIRPTRMYVRWPRDQAGAA